MALPVPEKIILAPMEGLADFWVRQSVTAAGGYDWCVSEFVRVNDQLLPGRVFHRWSPELVAGACTASGTPVHIQLLGSDPQMMAENAVRAVQYGAQVIDLNFGCPAKTVNRHRGGAVLLDEPALIHDIVYAVRRALPAAIPLSVKMRLGNRDAMHVLDNALAIEAGGAAWLTVHGRTRQQGYKPPAYWDEIGRVNQAVNMPVVANGEIWSVEDAQQCMRESGCRWLMLGRGAVADPYLAMKLRYPDRGGHPLHPSDDDASWRQILSLFLDHVKRVSPTGKPHQVAGRVKHWMHYMGRRWPQAQTCHEKIRREKTPEAISELIAAAMKSESDARYFSSFPE